MALEDLREETTVHSIESLKQKLASDKLSGGKASDKVHIVSGMMAPIKHKKASDTLLKKMVFNQVGYASGGEICDVYKAFMYESAVMKINQNKLVDELKPHKELIFKPGCFSRQLDVAWNLK